MKRLVWLLILVVGTALAQVSPVDLGVQSGNTCSCCEKTSTCGNRDCGLPPAACALTHLLAEQPNQPLSTAHKKAVRTYRLAINYLFPAQSSSAPTRIFCPPRSASVAPVPLFKAHCSFLI